jgi:hypothetical protein
MRELLDRLDAEIRDDEKALAEKERVADALRQVLSPPRPRAAKRNGGGRKRGRKLVKSAREHKPAKKRRKSPMKSEEIDAKVIEALRREPRARLSHAEVVGRSGLTAPVVGNSLKRLVATGSALLDDSDGTRRYSLRGEERSTRAIDEVVFAALRDQHEARPKQIASYAALPVDNVIASLGRLFAAGRVDFENTLAEDAPEAMAAPTTRWAPRDAEPPTEVVESGTRTDDGGDREEGDDQGSAQGEAA